MPYDFISACVGKRSIHVYPGRDMLCTNGKGPSGMTGYYLFCKKAYMEANSLASVLQIKLSYS